MKINSLAQDDIRSLIKDVYLFTYPLVRNYFIMVRRAIDSAASEYAGGFGVIRHNGLTRPGASSVVTPNNDTPTSYVWLDLRAEPWVITLPPVEEDRYYSAHVDDLWAFVADCPGAVLDGDKGGSYLVAPSDWQDEVPPDISRVIRCESRFAYCLMRTQIFDGESIEDLRAIRDRYTAEPLSSFLGNAPLPSAPAPVWPPFSPGDEKNPDVFRYVNFLLPYTVPHPDDAPLYAKMERLGLVAGQRWEIGDMSSEAWQAAQDGINDAFEAMTGRFRETAIFSSFFNDRARMGTRYLDRATGVYMGQFGMPARQAVYLRWNTDGQGMPIDTAQHAYEVTFTKDELPKARYFWSVTMYRLPGHDLYDNPLGRCSIGNRSRNLQYAPDGGVTIHISHHSPGPEKESNWLPAPASGASMIVRLYGPDENAMNGGYALPPLRRV